MACGSMVAGCTGTVIDVLAAVITCPAIHTHAVEAAYCIVTRATILAGIWGQLTLVHIFCAVLTCVFKLKVTHQSTILSGRAFTQMHI